MPSTQTRHKSRRLANKKRLDYAHFSQFGNSEISLNGSIQNEQSADLDTNDTIVATTEVLNLMDLPTEVIELGLFPYLTHTDLTKIRLNGRLKDIADSVIEKRDRKCK